MDGTHGLEREGKPAPLWDALSTLAPEHSARRTFTYVQLCAIGLIAAGLAAACLRAPRETWLIFYGGALSLFSVMILWRLMAAASAFAAQETDSAPPHERRHFPRVTLLCPLYRESAIAPELARALMAIDYPEDALEVLFVLEADDEETRAALETCAKPRGARLLFAPREGPRTKPKALNAALAEATGEFVAVYDAEDRPDPRQVRAALDAFDAGGAQLACVQAPLAIDNAGAAWLSLQFAAEYAIQFRQLLPFLARFGLPLPLGGTSNHFRREALIAVHAWDSYNVTEDADLGYRLARAGYRVGVIAPPTYEEAPVRLGAWLAQRSRWIKGHMQTWLVLMRQPWRTLRDLGLMGFLAMQISLLGGLIASFVHLPILLVLFAAAVSPADLLAPQDIALGLIGYVTSVYAAVAAGAIARDERIMIAAVSMPLYWPLSFFAGIRAFYELLIRPQHWAKTPHGAEGGAFRRASGGGADVAGVVKENA